MATVTSVLRPASILLTGLAPEASRLVLEGSPDEDPLLRLGVIDGHGHMVAINGTLDSPYWIASTEETEPI